MIITVSPKYAEFLCDRRGALTRDEKNHLYEVVGHYANFDWKAAQEPSYDYCDVEGVYEFCHRLQLVGT